MCPTRRWFEAIGEDPLLADTKIIAEAWDAAGAYQVGSFGDDRWAEWNGRYRDDIRTYWRGDSGTRGPIATRLSGSADLYQPGGRPPCSSINFITSHDGFTMNDLVSYVQKHNLANGENNRDGDNHNISENFGVEGPTDNPEIDRLRVRQIKNFLTTLMLSQGVPMLVAGDEFRRTQQGNNNAYCQDNEISWINWELAQDNADLVRFTRSLIEFRKNQPAVRREHFLTGVPDSEDGWPDVSWYNAAGTAVDWYADLHPVICLLTSPRKRQPEETSRSVLFLLNSSGDGVDFLIPSIAKSKKWRLFVDTSRPSPNDIFPDLNGPKLEDSGVYQLPFKASAVFVSND